MISMNNSLATETYDRKRENEDNFALSEYSEMLRKKYVKNKKVLFIQTLQFQLDAFNSEVARNRGYYVYPPQGLQCLVKALDGNGLEFKILDLNYQLLKKVREDRFFDPHDWSSIVDACLEEFQPSVIGVTCIGVATNLFKPTHPLTAVLNHLRKHNKQIVIAGGPIATDEFDIYLKHNLCHFVIQGEGENKIRFLFDHLFDHSAVSRPVKDIWFNDKGALNESKGEKDIVRMDGNLKSTYNLVPIENYKDVGSLNPFSRMVGVDTPFTSIQLNRGCRGNCKFCGVPKYMGRGLRQASLEDLTDELTFLAEERGIRHFELLDDDFLGTAVLREGTFIFLEHLKQLKAKYKNITWSAGNGLIAATMTEDLMQLIHDSGCVGFRIGVESGNEHMLKRLRKPASIKSLKKFVELLKPFTNIFVGANYIIGLFGEETFGQMLDTYHLSCELDVDWASYSTYQFTSKTTSEVEKLKDDGQGASECIPSKDAMSREIRVSQHLRIGTDVFNTPFEEIPSREQVKEIWFVFNFLSNYINNRNLRPGGNPAKLVSWLEAVHLTYPDNPYITLFAGYGYVLLKDERAAQDKLEKTQLSLSHSTYWKERFEQFGLFDLMNHFPHDEDEVYINLDRIKNRFKI